MKYIKCIGKITNCTIGKIYKVTRQDGDFISWLDNISYNSGMFSKNPFLIATEQEYNKQEGIINTNYYFY